MEHKVGEAKHTGIWPILTIYVIFSTLWVYLSDWLLFYFIKDHDQRVAISFYKGLSFILLSAALLYVLISGYGKRLKQAGETLRRSEERFRLIADSMPNLVWTAEPDGTIDYVNRTFKEYTGLTGLADENDTATLLHPDDKAATLQAWQNSILTGTPYEIEHRFRRHDGAYRWYLCRAIPIRDSGRQIIKWYATSTDIDDLKSALERIARILDSTSDGFIAIDRQWRVTYFNRKAEEMSGVKADHVVGRNYWESTPNLVGTRIETEYRMAMEENKSTHFEEFYERYGRLFDVYVHPYDDGIAIFFHDLSDRERAAKALQSRTAELESLLLYAPIGFAFFDREHRYLRINKALAEINGIMEKDTLGKSIGEVLPTIARIIEPILDQVMATGQAVEGEVNGETAKEPGITRHWLTGVFPVIPAVSESLAVGTYVVEITERKRAEEAMARLAAIVESAEDAILSETLEGIIQTWNGGAMRLYGYGPDEVLGRHVSLLVPPEGKDELEVMTRKIKEGFHDHFETMRLTKEGKRIFVSVTMSPIKDSSGRVVGVSKIVHDITSRKKTEEDLKQTVRSLEVSNRELQQFAHVASHDLQEPLRNVTRYVELLARKYKGHLGDNGEQYIDFAVEGARRIHDLINDLLAFSEVGAFARDFKLISMEVVAREAMDNLRQAIEESQAVITMDPMPEVSGERTQLVQLWQNIIGNAVKFRKMEVPLRIHISAEQIGNEWRFGIHDNGIGLQGEYFNKIFVIFQRLHARSEYSGTGIGLAICRKIVEWHGGRIWVESTYGEGASFYFTIPVPGGVV